VPDSPGVHVPPPFAYAAAVGLGAWASSRWPWHIGGGRLRIVTAYMLIVACAMLIASAFKSFWSRRTSVLPIRPAATLVVAGPYRFTRNPMYVAMGMLSLGAGLWLNSWWVIVFLIPALIVIDRFVITREEAYLRRRFGAAYEQYVQQVRRWV
jgi:protein-S-isoprenylcysteine O-methyltransferase Ste14